MSNETQSKPTFISEARFASLSPEDKRRVGMAMQFLVDLDKLHIEGLEIAKDLFEGKAPAADVGMKLTDFERSLRAAVTDLPKHPLRVVHADAVRKGETKLDDSAWLMRIRTMASNARKVREEEPDVGEPEAGTGMRP